MRLSLDAATQVQVHSRGHMPVGYSRRDAGRLLEKETLLLKTFEIANGQVCLCWARSPPCLQDSILGPI